MSEAKDPKIKLFGMTIQLPDNPPPETVTSGGDSGGGGSAKSGDASGEDSTAQDRACSTNSLPEESNLDKGAEEQESKKETLEGKLREGEEKHGAQQLMSEELSDSNPNPLENKNSNVAYAYTDAAPVETSKTEERCDNSNLQEKTPKKPDKVVPCPRCNSMDTKFCYFNNYNVSQPRHFCKNCQRYWTAGGTMRNVPVGAGRRKNKNSATQFGQITVPEALQNVRADLPNEIHHRTLNPNGTVLTFGSDTPLCESMTSVLNIAEKSMQNSSRNGFQQPEELRIPVSYRSGDSGDDKSCGSSLTAGNLNDEVNKTRVPETKAPNYPNFPPQVPCFPGGPWPYPWNSVQWSPPVMPPGFFPPGFPMPFYSAAPYWACNLPGTWNVPWVTQPTTPQNHAPPTSGPYSPTLGKHSRDDNQPASNEDEEPRKESNPEKCLWVPKTLRIDDPGEAARSSIWATLGIKYDKADSVGGGGLFKPFKSKSEEMTPAPKTSRVLQANPAALSRSLNFHESS